MSPKLGRSLADVGGSENERDYLDSICFLKKHKGKTWRMVVEEDPDYVLYILTELDLNLGERLRTHLMWALEDR